jgi:hypothetical protein
MAAARAREASPETLLTDGQRGIVLGLFAAGIAFLLVGLLLRAGGAVFWAAFVLLPPVVGAVVGLVDGGVGRRLDAWLRAGGAPRPAAQPVPASALPEPVRAALQVAAVPALLGELHRAAATMPREEKAAADQLLGAAVRAWNGGAGKVALAAQLPHLVAGLVAGGPEGIRAAQDAAARLGDAP